MNYRGSLWRRAAHLVTGGTVARSGVLASLGRNGFHLGRNLELVDRYAEGNLARLPGLARDAAANVNVVVALADSSVRAMLAVNKITPIVMVVGADPRGSGNLAYV
jgi:hypothetical protein